MVENMFLLDSEHVGTGVFVCSCYGWFLKLFYQVIILFVAAIIMYVAKVYI